MSVPPEIMQALQAGGAGPAGPGGGPGPSGPGAAPPPSITIPGGGAGPDGGDAKPDGDWEEDLHAALDALRQLASDATDHGETNIIDKCIAALSGLTSKRQAGAESALGVTPAHKAMARAY